MLNVLGPMPRYARLDNFLPQGDHERILEWILANQALFSAATITTGQVDSEDRVSDQKRVALTTSNLGPFAAMLTHRFFGALEEIAARAGSPVAAQSLELEFSAHGDGGFFGPHIDIPTGRKRAAKGGGPREDRLLSAVYYFHREPKAYSGGALRLFRFGAADVSGIAPGNHIDFEPVNNSLVAFGSTVLHEVRPVRCPTGRFEDFRFALNCWYCRAH